jgi:hypothetical protein
MAVKGLTALTLADWGKRVDPNGKVDKIIELLGQTNPILQDMPFVEGNLPTGHRTTIRSGLPSATWRLLNYGVQPSKSTTVQVTDSVGMLETYAEVDKSLADLNGNTAEFRLSEDRAFIEAMNQQMAQTLFYGDSSVNPQQFMGLSSRFLAGFRQAVNTAAVANIGQRTITDLYYRGHHSPPLPYRVSAADFSTSLETGAIAISVICRSALRLTPSSVSLADRPRITAFAVIITSVPTP